MPSEAAFVRRPVLITGSVRTGTTWVGRILQACPRVGVLHEPLNLTQYRPVFHPLDVPVERLYTYISDENQQRYDRSIRRLLSFQYWNWQKLRLSRAHPSGAVRTGMFYAWHRFRRARPILKDPLALMSADWFSSRFGANVVVMIRHPAAVVSSFKRLKWSVDFDWFLGQPLLMRDRLGHWEAELHDRQRHPRGLVEDAALVWKILYDVVAGYQREHPDWTFMRHEDLCRDPLSGFEQICRSCDLQFTEGVQRAIRESNRPGMPPEVDVANAFSTCRNSAAAVDTWKQRLTAAEIGAIRREVEPVAGRFYSDAEW